MALASDSAGNCSGTSTRQGIWLRLEAPCLPFDGGGDACIEDRRPQRGGHVTHQLEQVGDQLLHALQARLQAGVEVQA